MSAMGRVRNRVVRPRNKVGLFEVELGFIPAPSGDLKIDGVNIVFNWSCKIGANGFKPGLGKHQQLLKLFWTDYLRDEKTFSK
jgi:hypothetical protein